MVKNNECLEYKTVLPQKCFLKYLLNFISISLRLNSKYSKKYCIDFTKILFLNPNTIKML